MRHAEKSILKNRKGISVIISALLFVAAAITAGILVHNWAMTSLGSSIGSKEIWVADRVENMRERFTIESIWFDSGNVTITVRNIGTIPIVVASIYVDGELVLAPDKGLSIGEIADFEIPVSDEPHTFSIVTTRGNKEGTLWAPL